MDRFKLTQFIADVSKRSEKSKTEKNLLERLFNKDKLLYKKVG